LNNPLRRQLIEEGADELEKLAAISVGVGLKFAAESVLDRYLNHLADNADEWTVIEKKGYAGWQIDSSIVRRLLAVLRNGRTDDA
jgi:hypothetical protein